MHDYTKNHRDIVHLPNKLRDTILRAMMDAMEFRRERGDLDTADMYRGVTDVLGKSPLYKLPEKGKLLVYKCTRGDEVKYVVPLHAFYAWDQEDAMEYASKSAAYHFARENSNSDIWRPRLLYWRDLQGGWSYSGPHPTL